MDPARATYAEDGALLCVRCRVHSEAASASRIARVGRSKATLDGVMLVVVVMMLFGGLLGFLGLIYLISSAVN